jgi:hypothetical protein
VLYDDERHASSTVHVLEQLLERFEATSGGTNADYERWPSGGIDAVGFL